MRGAAGLLAALLFGILQAGVVAQQVVPDPLGWNDPAALRLMERASERRQRPRADTALRSYSARATGHVHFYLDREDGEEKTPVKVDQVALELYWAAPNLTKQRIVGLRDESRLPNRMYYHLDHLTVVQNGFGDVIRVGDGDEVGDVPHPAAPGADSIYDFRIANSLTLSFPGQPPVRVYEVQVRPKRSDRSAMIGTVFVDQASADIVRLTFTFTPASYVDRRLDYINISLDNGLWNGTYWLPNEQYVEIRRQIPELDFIAGAVIKGRLRVYDYEFNKPFPRDFFFGRTVEVASEADRKAFSFEEGIYAELDREGLKPPPQVADLRARAAQLIKQQKLSGLPPLRLYVPNASSVMRYNQAEGLFLGVGATYLHESNLREDAAFGYAFDVKRPSASVAVRSHPPAGRTAFGRAFLRDLRDVGLRPALPTLLNSFSAAASDRDYIEPYFASGAEAGMNSPLLGGDVGLRLGIERHDASRAGDRLQPARERVLSVLDGTLYFGRGRADLPLGSAGPFALRGAAEVELGVFDVRSPVSPSSEPGGVRHRSTYFRPTAELAGGYASLARGLNADLRISAGWLTGEAPYQRAFVLGGRATLPGNPYRGMVGTGFLLAEAELARDLWAPWVRGRLTAAAGAVTRRNIPATWPGPSTWPGAFYNRGTSIGVGLGLLWDVLRFDVVRGDGKPRLYFSVKRDLWDML